HSLDLGPAVGRQRLPCDPLVLAQDLTAFRVAEALHHRRVALDVGKKNGAYRRWRRICQRDRRSAAGKFGRQEAVDQPWQLPVHNPLAYVGSNKLAAFKPQSELLRLAPARLPVRFASDDKRRTDYLFGADSLVQRIDRCDEGMERFGAPLITDEIHLA